jgi:hypothetical protein
MNDRMTKAERNGLQKRITAMLNEVGEVGPMDTISDERLLKLIEAGAMQLAAASSPAVTGFIMPKFTTYMIEANARGISCLSEIQRACASRESKKQSGQPKPALPEGPSYVCAVDRGGCGRKFRNEDGFRDHDCTDTSSPAMSMLEIVPNTTHRDLK